MCKKLIPLILVLALASAVSATTIQWNQSQSTAWEDPLNWDLGRLPDISDNPVKLYKAADGVSTITVNSAGEAMGMKMQMKYGTMSLTIQSNADLLCDGLFEMYMGATATIDIMAGGVLDACKKINMTAGNFLIGGAGATDYVNVYGTLNVASSRYPSYPSELVVGASGTTGGGFLSIGSVGVVNCDLYDIQAVAIPAYIDIATGGEMYVRGDVMAQVDIDKGLGLFKGNGIPGNVIATYDLANDVTIIRVPEPATVTLLGLSGLVLFRSKRCLRRQY